MPLDSRAGFPTHWTRFQSDANQPALAIHCTLAHAGSWKGLAAELAGQVAMTGYDLPGHGRSGDWGGQGDIQAVSMDMAVDLLENETGGAAVIFGHSFGATVALRLAIERPDLVRALILVEPVFFAVAYMDDPDIKPRHAEGLRPYTDALAAGDLEQAARHFTSTWGDGRGWDRLPEAARADMAKRIHLVNAASPMLNDDSAGMLKPGVLGRVTAPALLLEGGESPEYVDVINRGLAARLSDASRGVVDGAGHMLPITHPVQTAALIRPFLERVAAG